MPTRPVLIVNPRSGDGRAAAVGLVPAALDIGLPTLVLEPDDNLAALAHHLVDQGHDHLMMAGGDGSLATVAAVAIARDVTFSCVPAGTRNHFAMDLGLDRRDPVKALAAAFDGEERRIDVGIIAGEVFLNNVSFGIYAQALADPDYRSHRARSIADAAVTTAKTPGTTLHITLADGRVIADADLLLASNNPYILIGPPDIAGRSTLGAGTLGLIVGDRQSGTNRRPGALTRWQSEHITVHSERDHIHAGVDGELRQFETPLVIRVAPAALRVMVPRDVRPKKLKASAQQLNPGGLVDLAGLRAGDETSDQPSLLGALHRVDNDVFKHVAGWESPELDRVLPPLSQAASYSRIWIAMALAIAIGGGEKGRKTALESMVAVGITSLLANAVAKNLVRRRRPTASVPEDRRLDQPTSSSMPSGHAASGAAFAHVVGSAYPALKAPLTALAGVIGFSRVYTGVHYPTDVAAGWLIGTGVATAVGRRRSDSSWRLNYRRARRAAFNAK